MKKVVTAIGNTYLNERLKDKYIVCSRDIQYQDGVIEILNEILNIDILLISNQLLGEYEFEKFLEKILSFNNSIEVIIFFSGKEIDYNFFNSKNIFKIYSNDKYGYENYLNTINNITSTNDIKENIEELRNSILKSNRNKSLSQNKKVIKKEIVKQEGKIEKSKTIIIFGNASSGKSVIACILSKIFDTKMLKTLVIENDVYNSSIQTMFGVKRKGKLMKVSKYIDLLEIENYDNKEDFWFFVDDNFKKYDYVILDISVFEENFIRDILKIADKISYVLEPNLTEIKKSRKMIEKLKKNYGLDVSKVNIIFNKVNKYKIADNVLKELFNEYKMIGKVPYNEKINKYINKNTNVNLEEEFLLEIYNNFNL